MSCDLWQSSLAACFWSSVEAAPDGCWLWTGPKTASGYGQFTWTQDGKLRSARAHRVAWELACGQPPGELYVCHSCDTPLCVRPEHLFLGSPAENAADCRAKGRHNRNVGEKNAHAKLTDATVIELRVLYQRGDISLRELARRYGVSVKAVHLAVQGRTWAHVSAERG